MLKTALLSGLASLVIAVDWLRFEEPRSGGGRSIVLAVLAITPLLLRPLWVRLAAFAVSALLAAWVAFSISPLALRPGGEGFFGPLGSRFSRGFLDFYDYRLPFDPAEHPRMHGVILIAIFGFTFAVALAVAARRALFAVVLFFIAAGWPATLLAGGIELGRGVAILAVTLALLAGMTERPTRLALIAAGAVLVGALALSSSPAVAKSAFLDWQHWDFYTRPQKAVSVRYLWDAHYDGVRFPKKGTTVLTIRAPQRSHYWRATVLDRFDGTRWLEDVWPESARERRELQPAPKRSRLFRQEVTVVALRDDHVIGASLPVTNDLRRAAAYEGQGVARVIGGLHRDQHYAVWSYSPRPTPEQLARVPPSYPRALTRPGRELDLAPGVTVPSFATAGRDARLSRLLTGRLLPYATLYERTRRVAGETRSPYAAAVALETWLRSTGGFTYSEHPGTTPGLPPLVGFVVGTKSGYCQHFAGAMAVMLRLLGIPSRVAAGFLPGRYHADFWQVTDRDAHTWVEVWFRGYGWLPFDPTPGRGHLIGTYSSTSRGFNAAVAAKLLAGLVKGGEVFGSDARSATNLRDRLRRNPRSGDLPLGIGSRVSAGQKKRTHSLLVFLFLLAAGVAAVIVLLKTARRKIRYLTRDPRRIAVACARELAEFVHDQRVPTLEAATFRELGGAVSDQLGVDATSFAQAATSARYGPPESARQAARSARKELHELKRRLRRSLTKSDRARGLLSVRSLGLG